MNVGDFSNPSDIIMMFFALIPISQAVVFIAILIAVLASALVKRLRQVRQVRQVRQGLTQRAGR